MNSGPEKIDLTDEILLDDGRWVCAATYPQFDNSRCYQWRKRPAPKHYPEADANGWIDRRVRPPTAGDASMGLVHWYYPASRFGDEYVMTDRWQWGHGATHWKPAGPGPVVETEEERQKREDFQAFKKWSEGIAVDDFHFYVWGAALAHARKQQGGAK